MKTVLLVPGFMEDKGSRDYASTIAAIEKRGYKVKFVPISWKRTTIETWVNELSAVYGKYDPQQTILAGFSYGAMTAFMVAVEKNPSELWLFSLSSYFAEDFHNDGMKDSWLRIIGHRRVLDFKKLNFEQLSKFITCKTLLFIGQGEIDKWPIMGERSNGAYTLLQNSRLIVVEGVGHDVADKGYISAIAAAI